MRVLVIAAHMDDEVLGPGGTVIRHVMQGDEVHACIAANRAYDHQYDASKISREKEACRQAAAILGYRELHFLDLRDELLDRQLMDVIAPLERVIASVQPDEVYTHHRGDLNQDHRAVFHAAMVACRPFGPHRIRRLQCFEVPSSTEQAPPIHEYAFQPNRYVDISATLARKQEAMRAYQHELRQWPHPRSLRGLEVLAWKRGMEVGCEAAEAFVTLRELWPAEPPTTKST